MTDSSEPLDVILIGGGIMSATLAAFITLLEPDWKIRIYERLSRPAEESSNPWNNAGTGHAALCELNYMPEAADGSLDASKAVEINEQFLLSREFWSFLVQAGLLDEPSTFINPTPHMTFVHGESDIDYLRRRYELLKAIPLFSTMEFSDDPRQIYRWAPRLMRGRLKSDKVAATRVELGTDVDFGALTRQLIDFAVSRGAELWTEAEVTSLRRRSDVWDLTVKHTVGGTKSRARARFVFVGAGGGALHLLQKSRIPEIRGYGGFPISGVFLRTDVSSVVAEHQAKVYGKAAVGSPPMSVPHLDARVVDGQSSLLFGPYAGFTPKFLKAGSWLDLPRSLRAHNILPMLAVARDNTSLLRYLLRELMASRTKRFAMLQEFYPEAKPADWYQITAGQRVQVMKRDPKRGGVLQFGTEVVRSEDGSIAGLLGASPGASTAVSIMLTVLRECFPERAEGWEPKLREMMPSLAAVQGPTDAELEMLEATAESLKLSV